jgi:hypothetical protein
MFHTNDRQSKRIDELIRLLMIPDLTGNCWFLKQIYFVPNPDTSGDIIIIRLVFVDKVDLIMFRSIDDSGKDIRS